MGDKRITISYCRTSTYKYRKNDRNRKLLFGDITTIMILGNNKQ